MRTRSKKMVELGELIAIACDRAATHPGSASDASRRAAIATVKALIFTGNVRALARLTEAERALH